MSDDIGRQDSNIMNKQKYDSVRVGIIGCGDVCDQYIRNIKTFDFIEIKSASDINTERAEETAKKHSLKAVLPEDLLSDPQIELIVNLTPPAAHRLSLIHI